MAQCLKNRILCTINLQMSQATSYIKYQDLQCQIHLGLMIICIHPHISFNFGVNTPELIGILHLEWVGVQLTYWLSTIT